VLRLRRDGRSPVTLAWSDATSPDERAGMLREVSVSPPWALQGIAAAPSAGHSVGYPRERRRSDRRVSLSVISGLLRAVDCVVVFMASWLAFVLHIADTGDSPSSYILLGLVGSFLAGNALQFAGAYQLSAIREPLSGLGGSIQAVVAVALIFIVIGFFTQTSIAWSRLWAGLWFVLTIAGLTGARAGLLILTRRWAENGSLRRNVAVVGAGAEAERLLAHIASINDPTVRIVGVFDNRATRVPKAVAGHPVRGRVADLREFTKVMPVDEVIVTIPWTAEDSLVFIFSQLRCLPVDVRLAPGPIGYRLLSRPVSHLAQLPLLHVADRPLDDWGRMLKWLEDRILGSLILLLIALPMALIALAIKLDSPGPVLFRQKRYGLNNQLIEVLKFRTMCSDLCDPNGVVSTKMNDARLTRVGKFLRRASLDELPQFINVLRGEMSIVGPRPHATQTKAGDKLLEEVVAEYGVRHKVKPGITGWAQINGWRGTIDSIEKLRNRVEFDIYYLENWSLLFDLKIIALTPLKGFIGKEAY
jgi:Undecaprenyl-phosphate glucose phosphotransferase